MATHLQIGPGARTLAPLVDCPAAILRHAEEIDAFGLVEIAAHQVECDLISRGIGLCKTGVATSDRADLYKIARQLRISGNQRKSLCRCKSRGAQRQRKLPRDRDGARRWRSNQLWRRKDGDNHDGGEEYSAKHREAASSDPF